ncbi:ABC transporter ATP-binding protein [Polycladidibacter hongkongensis]|uniref:ABC transporter ATP-binding protein n=1 Tax=Polycladidibacter hongkongensis TaxID=1647556 RepID=UPI0008320D25|nr:ABC transporter ATP-binding protein [Pseudovibrio hongkongensis]
MSIQLHNVTAGYDGFKLSPISLELERGSLCALIGPNGCGKSTLLKTIARVLQPLSGEITVGGLNSKTCGSKALARTLSFQPQHPVVPPAITVEQLVGYGRAPHQSLFGIASKADKEAVQAAMAQVGLSAFADRRLSALSGGQRQRAFIAMSLAQEAPYILLDEPTAFLDVKYQFETLDLLQHLHDLGRTCIVVLHDIAQAARYADDLVIMREGQVYAQGAPKDVVSEEMLHNVYGVNAQIYADPESGTPALSPRVKRAEAQKPLSLAAE